MSRVHSDIRCERRPGSSCRQNSPDWPRLPPRAAEVSLLRKTTLVPAKVTPVMRHAAKKAANTVREAVGVFSTLETLQEAIDELMSSGFDRADLSMLAAEGTVDQKLGHKYQKIAELEDDPIVPRCCYVSTESIGDAQAWLVGGLM